MCISVSRFISYGNKVGYFKIIFGQHAVFLQRQIKVERESESSRLGLDGLEALVSAQNAQAGARSGRPPLLLHLSLQ